MDDQGDSVGGGRVPCQLALIFSCVSLLNLSDPQNLCHLRHHLLLPHHHGLLDTLGMDDQGDSVGGGRVPCQLALIFSCVSHLNLSDPQNPDFVNCPATTTVD